MCTPSCVRTAVLLYVCFLPSSTHFWNTPQKMKKITTITTKNTFFQEYWEHTYEDVLDVVAKMPEVAALIYRCKFKDGKVKKDLSLDYTGNYCAMMGYDDKAFQDLMRLYLVIHSVRGRGRVGGEEGQVKFIAE